LFSALSAENKNNYSLRSLRLCGELSKTNDLLMAEKEKKPKKKKAPPPQPHKGWVLWIGLFVFACGWMFVLGILVGRGTAPVRFDIEKLQKELASLKEAVIKKERLRFKIDSNSAPQKTDMDFYESLKTSDSSKDKKSNRVDVASKPPKKSLPKTAHSGRGKKDILNKAGAAKPSRDSLAEETRSSTEHEKKITIQVASLRDPQIADRMVARLKDKWYPAYKAVAEIPGKGIWYRVRIGSFKNRATAQSTLERLKKDKIEAVLLPQ